jgi:uncharacterized SAM-binding protein YcdF (DUF218 family)
MIFTVLGILFVLYFVNISIYWGRADSFNKAMIFIGFAWIIMSVKIEKIPVLLKKLPGAVKIFLKICAVVFALSFIIIEWVIMRNMRTTAALDADYVMVLGCQVDGSIPSIPLIRRVNTAVKYLNENKNAGVVITGGKGPGENISEAEAMKRILIRNGIEHRRIFEESGAKSTMENFKFSNELYNLHDKNVVVVSSDYHMFRALSMAKKLNYKNVSALPSKSQVSVLPVYLLREYAAVVYYLVLRRI